MDMKNNQCRTHYANNFGGPGQRFRCERGEVPAVLPQPIMVDVGGEDDED